MPTPQLSPEIVLYGYSLGMFPMYLKSENGIGWFQPDPRTIIPLDRFHISRSLAKTIRKDKYSVTFNHDFLGVMRGCADRAEGTWISDEFYEVYGALHKSGYCQSVEVWEGSNLVGGTYGIAIGGAFMAESMFHYATDASKVALAHLVHHLKEKGFALLDVQYLTPHLASLGATEIPHRKYLKRLNAALKLPCVF